MRLFLDLPRVPRHLGYQPLHSPRRTSLGRRRLEGLGWMHMMAIGGMIGGQNAPGSGLLGEVGTLRGHTEYSSDEVGWLADSSFS